MKTCTYNHCQNKHDSHGYCANHARQYKKYGHPLSAEEKHRLQSEAATNRMLKFYAENPDRPKRTWSEEKRLAAKGRQCNTGRTHFKEGMTPWLKGTTGLVTAWNKGKQVPATQNEKHPFWKGDEVSYRSLHKWVERYKGKGDICEHCRVSGLSGHSIHWSNISGEYKRDLSDWQRLCAKCHGAYDSGKLILARNGG